MGGGSKRVVVSERRLVMGNASGVVPGRRLGLGPRASFSGGVLTDLKTLAKSRLGSPDGALGDFGFSSPSRQTPDEATKVATIMKRAATREARHTMRRDRRDNSPYSYAPNMASQRAGVRVGILLLAGVAFAAGACANLLGIDDRSIDPTLDGGGAGGSGATSGVGSGASESSGVSTTSGDTSGTVVSSGSLTSSGGSGAIASGSTTSSGIASGASSGGTSGSGTANGSGTSSGGGSGTSSGSVSMPDAGADSQPVDNCPDPCVLATKLNHPFQMTSDATRVYWTEFGDDIGTANGFVKSCPLTGCGTGAMVYSQAQINPRGIAVDAQNVYWGSASYGAVNGAIWSCALTGCTSPTKLASAGIPYGVWVDTTYVYWVDNDDGSVHRILKPNNGDKVLYDGGDYATGFPVSEPQQCVSDGTFVYLNDYFGDVYRVPVAGGDPFLMASGAQAGGWPLAIDATYVYFGDSGFLYRMLKTSAFGKGTVIATGISDPDTIVIDPATNTVYWADWGSGNADDGTVGKVGVNGMNQTVLASSLQTPEAVTVSGSYVFWLSNGTLDTVNGGALAKSGSLMRTAK